MKIRDMTLECIDYNNTKIRFTLPDDFDYPAESYWNGLLTNNKHLTLELLLEKVYAELIKRIKGEDQVIINMPESGKTAIRVLTAEDKRTMHAMDLGTTTSMVVSRASVVYPLSSSNVDMNNEVLANKDDIGEDIVSSYKTDMTIDEGGNYSVISSAIVIQSMLSLSGIDPNKTDMIISAPAYFTQRQRLAIKRAGSLVGVNVKHIVNEPTAAAIKLNDMGILNNQKLLVVLDIGGGTYDVTILKHENDDRFKILHTDGGKLGGDDIDNQLFMSYKTDHSIPLALLAKHKKQVVARLRQAKCQITPDCKSVKVSFEDLGLPNTEVTLENLSIIVNSLFKGVITKADDLLIGYSNKFNCETELAFVGGSTYSCVVQQLEQWFTMKHSIVEYDLKRDEVVSLGLQVLLKSDNIEDMLEIIELTDMYRIKVLNDPCGYTIIQKGSNIPCMSTTVLENSAGSLIHLGIYQGTAFLTDNNSLVGSIVIKLSKEYKDGSLSISVLFKVDNNLLLVADVEVIDKATFEIVHQHSYECVV